MIVARGGERCSGGVASLTGRCGRDMRCGLATCRGSIVAGGAVAGHARVVPLHREERERVLVAALARCGRGKVARRLGSRMRAVVAVGAGASDLVVIEAHLHPGRGGMASLAVGRGRSMRAALPGGDAAIVAADALPGRALKTAIDVARRAIDAVMAARERETCREVVERPLLRLGARAQKLGPGHPEAEQDRNCPQQPVHQFTAYVLRFFFVFLLVFARAVGSTISAQPKGLPDMLSGV